MTAESTDALTEQIKEALRLVIDPELGYNIVDLGLVYDVAVEEDGAVNITMTTTTRGCPATDYLTAGARDATESVPSIQAVDVRLTYDPPWTPRLMSAEAKQYLGIADNGAW